MDGNRTAQDKDREPAAEWIGLGVAGEAVRAVERAEGVAPGLGVDAEGVPIRAEAEGVDAEEGDRGVDDLTEEKVKTDIDCKCRLRLNSRQTLEKIDVPKDAISASNQCNGNDFTLCTKACNEKISNETNGYDLTKPKAGAESTASLGQSYCDQIGHDLKDARIYLSVTLECDVEREVTQEVNGTAVSMGSSVSQSSISRFVESGFKQAFSCVNKTFAINA
ncbi:unnamed protein product [Oppiella nova]|uniref:Uncharacterized protein n=1 Tax=Oppiella nova TaxID=334625 RepID=A0A7R9QB31_9ACAR|nr:unnamed protein product [Oppiella nova]CAG2160899.1 unnamed protein product [Oppiella nova]